MNKRKRSAGGQRYSTLKSARGLTKGRAEGLTEGRARGLTEGKRDFLLRAGTRRFGAPEPSEMAALAAIANDEELDRLADRLFEVETWRDLLA